MGRLEVVCALFEWGGKVAAFQRAETNCTVGGKWELPGGKIEQGESREQALQREIQEELELGVELQAIRYAGFVDHDYPHLSIRLHCFRVEKRIEKVVLHEHQEFCWVEKEQALTLDWADADRVLMVRLIKENRGEFVL